MLALCHPFSIIKCSQTKALKWALQCLLVNSATGCGVIRATVVVLHTSTAALAYIARDVLSTADTCASVAAGPVASCLVIITTIMILVAAIVTLARLARYVFTASKFCTCVSGWGSEGSTIRKILVQHFLVHGLRIKHIYMLDVAQLAARHSKHYNIRRRQGLRWRRGNHGWRLSNQDCRILGMSLGPLNCAKDIPLYSKYPNYCPEAGSNHVALVNVPGISVGDKFPELSPSFFPSTIQYLLCEYM